MKDSFLMANPFKMYRYEVIGAYVDFIFYEGYVPLRPSKNEDGYDDVTDLDAFEDFSDEIKLRFLPFMEQITEDEYIEIHDKVIFDDFRITQSWGLNPSDTVLLINEFQKKSIRKINADEFLLRLVRHDYTKDDGSDIELNDIKSFDMLITYYYDKSFDSVLVQLKNIEFNCEFETRSLDTNIDSGLYVPQIVIEYYFGVERNAFKRRIVSELLQKEYLISPAMIFNADLYISIRDKIKDIKYEVSREK
jgi:hypothetical protein